MQDCVKVVGFAAVIASVLGCAGSGDKVVTSKFTVTWAQRSRDTAAPTAARSFRLVVRGAKTNGADFIFIGNRPDDPAPATVEYTISSAWIQSPTTVFFEFYPDKDAYGRAVAFGQSSVTPTATGITIPTVNANSTIASVVIAPQSIAPNSSKDLSYACYDGAGAIVPVSYGSAIWQTSDENLLTFSNGTANAKNVNGHVRVIAKVNEISSASTSIPIFAPVNYLNVISLQTLSKGSTSAVSFVAQASNGTTIPLDGTDLQWTSDDPTIISFSNAKATALKTGSTLVQCSYQNPDGTRIYSPKATVKVN